MKAPIHILATVLLLGGIASVQGAPFYKNVSGLFSTRPDDKKSLQTIDRFGPVGMAIELHQPAFVMKVGKIEDGSPAAATGELKPGQIIETINGQKLRDIDPRIQLGMIIEQTEASDGAFKFMVKDTPDAKAREVVVMVPVLGAYSGTWPLNCPKSDKIVRGFADYLSKPDSAKGFGDIGMLFLLATGEDKDLETVREWAHKAAKGDGATYAWHLGYGGIPLCEYYLRTGDPEVLPGIQKWVDNAVKAQYLDGWAGRGGVAAVTYGGGGGHLNAGGTAVVTFLLLAKECGVIVPDHALHGALTHFFRFAGRGNNPYGDNKPEGSFVDNGKNGNLAFAMAAAASLTPNGEQSIYAKARDAAAMTSFYTTTFMLHGHTGGGVGEIWRSAAMGLLTDKKPKQYREFMDNRKWHYELSRRWDGSFGILGGARYDDTSWGTGYALTYVIPRKTLRVTGAPPSKFSKQYQLPERPWGTQADDAFESLEAAADKDGNRQDLSQETLADDSGNPLIGRLNAMGDISDDVLRKYAHHQDILIRQLATKTAMGIEPNYMWIKSVGRIRTGLVQELIQSKDPRVRHAVLSAMISALRNEAPEKVVTRETFDPLIAMIKNPGESWFVKDAALQLVGSAPADWVAPHVDLLLPYLKHQDWWLQNAALIALGPVVADERCYQKVLPAIGDMLRTCQRWNATSPVRYGTLPDNLRKAGPEVRKLAADTLAESYTGFTGTKTAAGGQDITATYDSQLEFLAGALTTVEGGYDVLYKIAKERFPKDPLPYQKIFLAADPADFGPGLRKTIEPIILDKLVYEYIGRNLRKLQAEIQGTRQSGFVSGVFDELADLYRKAGVHDYDWHPFGPDLKNATWDYFTFDPPEKQKHDISPWRYRPVTYPKGMENWFAPDFVPASAAWKKGQPPFGQYKGELVSNRAGSDTKPDCIWENPPRSLWEKEVLLVRGNFEFPPLKPGHRYRIRVGSGHGVGSGDGYKIYLNGKPLVETKEGLGKRQGASPRGGFITEEFVGEFTKGPVTIAATSFLRYGNRAIVQMPPVPQGIFSLWLEEMKLPPVDDEALRKSAAVIPMLSSAWQARQDPDNTELQGGDDRFHYDGKFGANPKVLGSWTAVAVVPTAGEFNPGKPVDANRAPIKSVTFKAQGLTDSATLIWSGDTLMDLDRYHALKITPKTIEATDYLLIEAGGFSEKNPVGWKTPLIVMKRK